MNSIYLKYNNYDSLDPTKLDQLITLGKDIDEDVLGQLITIHKETCDSILYEMQKFLTQKKYEELKRCAHKFKSSSANLGLMRLHKMCSDLEAQLGKTQSSSGFKMESLEEFVESIYFECHQTNQKLLSYQKVA